MIAFINLKRVKVRHIVYNAIQISLVVSKFKIFQSAFLVGTSFASSQYVYYFLPSLSCGSKCRKLDNIHFE